MDLSELMAGIAIGSYIMITHHSVYARIYKKHWITAMILFCWALSYGMQLPTLFSLWGKRAHKFTSNNIRRQRNVDLLLPIFRLGVRRTLWLRRETGHLLDPARRERSQQQDGAVCDGVRHSVCDHYRVLCADFLGGARVSSTSFYFICLFCTRYWTVKPNNLFLIRFQIMFANYLTGSKNPNATLALY